jgi:hypothetical protein
MCGGLEMNRGVDSRSETRIVRWPPRKGDMARRRLSILPLPDRQGDSTSKADVLWLSSRLYVINETS